MKRGTKQRDARRANFSSRTPSSESPAQAPTDHFGPFCLGLIPPHLTAESVPSLLPHDATITAMLRSYFPPLVAGGRRYAAQRTAPKFVRSVTTPPAKVRPFSVCGFCTSGSRTHRIVCVVQLKKTGLYDFHMDNGAKMVPFAGYSMPLSYGNVGAGELYLHA